jgi:hypothetical protein
MYVKADVTSLHWLRRVPCNWEIGFGTICRIFFGLRFSLPNTATRPVSDTPGGRKGYKRS